MQNQNTTIDNGKIAKYIYNLCKTYNDKETIIQLIENELKIAYVEGEKNKLQEIIWS